MRRRQLLTALSATAVSACAAAIAPSRSPSTPSTPAPSPPTRAPPSIRPSPTLPSPPNWNALRAQLVGMVLEPTTPGYDEARRIYNPRFDGVRPQAVALCTSVADVQACVRFARANALPLALRSGGHSYAGWSTGTGLVIDVAGLAAISVANGTVTVGAGARLIDLYDAVAAAGAGLAAGSCPTVGATGLTLGGGLGVLTRAWGLTCDQLTNIDIVTADGELRHCDANSEPELFWALRGGGGGNFGVVTALRFATHPVGDLALGFLTWPWSKAAAVLDGWQRWMAAAPDALWSTLHLEGGASPAVTVHAVHTGSAAEIKAQLDALVTAAVAAPDYRESGARTYRDVMLLEAGCLGGSVAACHLKGTTPSGELGRETFAAKSIVVPRTMSTAAIGALIDAIAGASGVGAAILIDALGGAAARVAPDATAFPHRSATAVIQLYTSWQAGTSGDSSIAWLRAAHDRARPLIGTGAYVNYIDPDLADWADAYYGANLGRLRAVKRQYDPTRLFDFPQAV